MYAIRSRAAQSSCRCRTCLHTPNGLVRRATHAAPRRKVTATELFTASYTTILGAATIIDYSHKQYRKKELDKKLETARANLSTLASETTAGLGDDLPGGRTSHDTDAGDHRDPAIEATAPIDPTSREFSPYCTTVRRQHRKPSWMRNQIQWLEIESAIAMEQRDHSIDLREPKNFNQLEKSTALISSLVQDLIAQEENFQATGARRREDTNEFQRRHGEESLSSAIELLESPFYPSYTHELTDPKAQQDERNVLAESLRRTFNQGSRNPGLVGTVCYNLLVSRVSPTIHHYNTLISGFSRVQRPDLAEVVIDSFLDGSPWPATQQTMVCLLYHYIETSNYRGFLHVVGRMRGAVEDGLHLRVIPKTDGAFLKWHDYISQYCNGRKHTWVERAYRSDAVFDALIQGWLHFGHVRAATNALIGCLRSSCLVPVQTLEQVLVSCVSSVNPVSARRLVREFSNNAERFLNLMIALARDTPIEIALGILDKISEVLDLCEVSFKILPDRSGSSRMLEFSTMLAELRPIISRIRLQLQGTQQQPETKRSIPQPPAPQTPEISHFYEIPPLRESRQSAALGYHMLHSIYDTDMGMPFQLQASAAPFSGSYTRIEKSTRKLVASAAYHIQKHGINSSVDSFRSLDPRMDDVVTGLTNFAPDHPNFSVLAALIGDKFQKLERQTQAIVAHATDAVLQLTHDFGLLSLNLPGSSMPSKAIARRKQEAATIQNGLQHVKPWTGPSTLDNVKLQLIQGMPDQRLARQFLDHGNWQNIAFNVLLTFHAKPHAQRFNLSSERIVSTEAPVHPTISEAEIMVSEAEEVSKVVLFCLLRRNRQERMRARWPKWKDMPMEKLLEYHLRTKGDQLPTKR